jgi:hypothetical protein
LIKIQKNPSLNQSSDTQEAPE